MSAKNNTKYASSFREQFTLRAVVIGCIGTAILTMSSMYVALKLGALPWPIVFVALVSMFFLKGMGGTNLNEINVAHTAMSAGAMVAGGLAFTIPGIYILNPSAQISFAALLIICLGGTILGLIFTALIRGYFVVTKALPYPMGQAAAETVMAGDEGGKKSTLLFITLGLSAVFTLLRDFFKVIPATFMNKSMMQFGSYTGLWLSPMLIGVGYLIGPLFIGVWFVGGLIGDFAILLGGVKLGLFTTEVATAIKSSLGIGIMVGTGFGIIVKGILPKAKEIFAPLFSKSGLSSGFVSLRWAPIIMIVIAFLFSVVCKMGVVASVVTLFGVWLATSMSAQVVGQSGINPMEIFGIIALLAAKALSPNLSQTSAFFVAAVVAISCGLAGDIMNDFKAGYILKSNPKAQWLAECIGGIVGAVVSALSFFALVKAYGATAFGNPEVFIAPQAGAVAAMVGGIPHMPAFVIGIVMGILLYCFNFPVMTLGLGVYLPFYLSATVAIGGAIKFATARLKPKWEEQNSGVIISSGLLGGEAVIGVVIAMFTAVTAIFAA